LALVALVLAPQVAAQSSSEKVVIPNFWDLRQRAQPGDVRAGRVIRFLVDDDFPPFHYLDAEGRLVGFSVDIARALCAELRAACTVQSRQWDTLLDSLDEGRGDAVIAAMRVTVEIKARFAVTLPYHRSPARFLARLGADLPMPAPHTIQGRRIAVVAGSAHEAFLTSFFADAKLLREPDIAAVLARVKAGDTDYAFGDGVALSLWLAGEGSASCCAFRGGPYLEPRFFGEGIGIILRKDQLDLRRALDEALAALSDKGVYGELYLKHFPVGFY
jgi:polar amino acid transport system substrate-binding protein